ncbi:MAG: hypothetical protein IPO08_14480 [Xanthomonadales bacterium]|nr:hypothetical protein [Xanthomonadales bacterium]
MFRRCRLAFLSFLAALWVSPTQAVTLRYQGELLDRGLPANGHYDLQLTAFVDADAAAPE